MSLLKNIWPSPIHSLLVPVFFIVHNYFDFWGLTDLNKLITSIISWLITPVLLLLFYKIILKDWHKSSILTTCLLCIYFFTGPLMKEFKDVPFLHFFFKYSVFIPVVFILLILLHVQLFKSKKSLKKIHLFLSVMFLLLLLIEFSQYAIKGPIALKKRNTIELKNDVQLTLPNKTTDSLPDIYFFIFDEHPSSKSLNSLFNYNNFALDSGLSKLDFKVSANATSQFPYTTPSIYSLMGLNEFHSDAAFEFTFKEIWAIDKNLTNNKLIPFFQNNGYKFINASIFDMKNAPSQVRNYLDWNTAEDMIRKQTIFNRIKEDLSWNYTNLFKRKFIGDLNLKIKKEVDYTNRIVQLIDSCLLAKQNNPKLFYGHFHLPHDTYKYDRKGNVIQWTYETYLNSYTSAATYLAQLEYTRKFIIDLAIKIKNKNNRPAIIIIQGDHGYRMFDQNKFPLDYKLKIFSAIYFPDHDYSQVSDSLFSPNTFRIILNKYFDQKISLINKKE